MASKRHKVPKHVWQNRITGSGMQAADQFLSHPDNWRMHPTQQEEALMGILDKVGWVQEVIVNKRTGRVVDGHLRILAALKRGDATPVPYKEIDVTEHEEALLLASLDPISALATTNSDKYTELVGLLPEEYFQLAKDAWGKDAPVSRVEFDVTEKHTVIVTVDSERAQQQLMAKLVEEGYSCKTGH